MNNNFTEKANFIWSAADLIRDDFKRVPDLTLED